MTKTEKNCHSKPYWKFSVKRPHQTDRFKQNCRLQCNDSVWYPRQLVIFVTLTGSETQVGFAFVCRISDQDKCSSKDIDSE